MAFLGGSVSMVQFVWAGTPGAGPSRLQWPWCATVVSEQTNLHNLHNLHIQVGLWLPAAVKKARLKCKFLVCVTFVLVFWAHVLYSHRFHWDFLPLSLSQNFVWILWSGFWNRITLGADVLDRWIRWVDGSDVKAGSRPSRSFRMHSVAMQEHLKQHCAGAPHRYD